MSTTGLEVFDKSIHTTNAWLKDISGRIGPDRRLAWHVLGVVLRALRDRLPAAEAAHLAAQLPLVVRGTYYDQYRPAALPDLTRSRAEFVRRVADQIGNTRPVDPEDAIRAVFAVLDDHVGRGETEKIRHALPEDVRTLWPQGGAARTGKKGNSHMKVSELMTRTVHMASPDEPLQTVARRMAADDIGFLPVSDGDRLVGMITDRDIVVRSVAAGADGQAVVRDAMTPEVRYCFEDEDIGHVIQNMGNIQVRRLPVVDRNKRLVGIISLADAALKEDPEAVGVSLTGVVVPGGQHSQRPVA